MTLSKNSGTRGRLGIYLLGIAIGLVLLGMFELLRRQAARNEEQTATTPAK